METANDPCKMFLTRAEYDHLLKVCPCEFQRHYLSCKRVWCITGVAVSGTETRIAQIRNLLKSR